MRSQQAGDTVRIGGQTYTVVSRGPVRHSNENEVILRRESDDTLWRAYGFRAQHNSKLHEVAQAATDQAAPAATCSHQAGTPGCELPTCGGVPSDAVIMDRDRTETTPEPTPGETGVSVFGRMLAESLRNRMRADVTAPVWECSRGLAYGDPAVRRAAAHTLSVDGRTVRVINYTSRGQLTADASYYAVTVDGFMIENGRMIPAERPTADVVASIGYAIMKHVELITPDTRVTADMPAAIPTGATLRPSRLADLRPGDVIRSFFDYATHATVTGHPTATMYGGVEVPVSRGDQSETMRGERDKTFCVIVPADQAAPAAPVELPADVPAAPAPVDQAATDQAAPAATDRVAFTVDREALADALAYLVKGLPRRIALPVLSGVMLTADTGDTVRLSVFDWDHGRSVELPATDVTTGRGLVTLKTLADVVKSTPKIVAAVRVDLDGGAATIKAGAASLTLPTMPAVDYPTLPTMPAASGLVDVHALADAVARVAVAAGTDETLPTMTHVHASVDGGAWQLAATDRYRLAVDAVTWLPVADAGAVPETLIPARQLSDAVRAFARSAGKAPGSVAVGFSHMSADGRASGLAYTGLSFGRYAVTMRACDGEFPPVRALIPATVPASATVDTRGLVDAVKRVSQVLKRSDKVPVRLTFTRGEAGDAVTVKVGGDEDQEPTASETITAGVAFTCDPGFMIAFNPSYLVDTVKACGGTRVHVSLVTSTKPAVFRDADAPATSAYAHLLMPIRTGDGAARDAVATPNTPKGDTTMTSKPTSKRARKTADQAAPAATPAPVTADQAAPDRETIERIAQAAHDAMIAGDYAGALAHVAKGETAAPGHLVAGLYPWATVRDAINRRRDQAATPAPVPAAPVTTDQAAPAAPAAPVTTAATRTGATIVHGASGTLLTGTPYPLRFKVSALISSRKGGRWTWSKDAVKGGAWIMDGSAGAAPDRDGIAQTVTALAGIELPVYVDPAIGAAPAATPAPAVELPADQAAPAAPAVGTYARIIGATGNGEALTLTGYVSAVAVTGGRTRVHVAPGTDGARSRPVYIGAGSRVDLVDAPAATPAPVPAAPVPAPVDAATLAATAGAARATIAAETAAPAPVPTVDQADASDALMFTLAGFDASVGMSYRASRKAAREALKAAGITADVIKDADNRRRFSVVCADPADRARVAAVVCAVVRTGSDADAPAAV